jgi:hypothetical protein
VDEQAIDQSYQHLQTQAIVSGAGFGIGEDLINYLFR